MKIEKAVQPIKLPLMTDSFERTSANDRIDRLANTAGAPAELDDVVAAVDAM